jgi:hypothetical protein
MINPEEVWSCFSFDSVRHCLLPVCGRGRNPTRFYLTSGLGVRQRMVGPFRLRKEGRKRQLEEPTAQQASRPGDNQGGFILPPSKQFTIPGID